MELDVVAYQPIENRILHVEPSLDADSWEKRERRFIKKFEAGRKYIFSELFPWLPVETPLQQRAILISAAATRRTLAGAEVVTVDEFMAEVRETVRSRGVASRAAIPEQYPMLRAIQLTVSGYYRVVPASTISSASVRNLNGEPIK
jgi:hypothetical protein